MVYVDDIVLTGSSLIFMDSVVQFLQSQFAIKTLGKTLLLLRYWSNLAPNWLVFESIKVYFRLIMSFQHAQWQTREDTNWQHWYTAICQRPSSSRCIDLQANSGEPIVFEHYASKVCFSVNRVSQFMHDPQPVHWKMLNCIIRYLADTPSLGLFLHKSTYLTLNIYCDANHGGSPIDRKSTTGFAIFLGPNLISWSSRNCGIYSGLT